MSLRCPPDIRQGLEGPYSIYPEALRPSRTPLTIVCGSPGSGKSTFVRGHADRADLVLDLDLIKMEIGGAAEHSLDDALVGPALRVRNERLMRLSGRPVYRAAWLLVGEPRADRRDWWRSKLTPAEVIVVETPLDECLRRIAADATRDLVRSRMNALARTWWEKYTRSPLDTVVTPDAARRAPEQSWGFW